MMSEFKGTPGPWLIVNGFMGRTEIESGNERDTDDPCVRFTIARDIGGRVHGQEYDDYSEVDANAKLIAAAPDLLEALIEAEEILRALGSVKYSPATDAVADRFKSIIDKATINQ